MSQSLPVGKFKWVDIPEDFHVMSFPENGKSKFTKPPPKLIPNL